MHAAEPFDRARRRLHRDRAARGHARVAPIFAHAADELTARLIARGRHFGRALDLGCRDGALRLPAGHVVRLDAASAWVGRGVQADEDRLPFAEPSFDLIATVGALQSVNDLPGCLVQCCRALRTGGVVAGVFPGGATLLEVRRVLVEAEEALTGGIHPRVHPMVDPREMAGLLQRAGFADPVVDVETLQLRYGALADLVRDLRDAGETSLLAAPAAMSRALAAAAARGFSALADDDGRVTLTVELIHFAASAPGT